MNSLCILILILESVNHCYSFSFTNKGSASQSKSYYLTVNRSFQNKITALCGQNTLNHLGDDKIPIISYRSHL